MFLPFFGMLFLYGLRSFQTLLELIHSSTRVNEFLLAGKEGVALCANLDSQVAFRRASPDLIAACARNRALLVFRMNSLLHFAPPEFLANATLICVP